jgi:hypothetical protein
VDYLPALDPDLYKNLMFLKNYEGDVEDLSLNFTVVDQGLPPGNNPFFHIINLLITQNLEKIE